MNMENSEQVLNRLHELGYTLPVLPVSKGLYKRCLQVGNLLFLSGHISVNNDGSPIRGKAGLDVSDDEAKAAARQCGLAMLAALHEQGLLGSIKRVVKLLGMVNATPDYTNHPVVINGCSELFAQIWGEENGIGTRSAVGMGSLPNNVTVEIEGIFELQ
jgi:enamine deaminase RidA (YjgF/YER057c/UK114 family)